MKRARKKSWSLGRKKSRADSVQPKQKKQKKLNKFAIFGISFAAIIVLFIAVLGISSLFDQPGISEDNYLQPVEKATGKTNMLVLGVDKRGLLTDTMIVVSYNTDENTMKLLSIPRDTRMYIGTHYQKINAAYAVAHNSGKEGAQGSVEAVTRLTGIPINYYVKFSTTALRDLVDALGGVEFDVPQDMNYDDPAQDLHIHLRQGLQTLDGDKAEQLVRFRRYRDGDIQRVKTQQQFLQAVIDQKLNAGIIQRIPDLFGVVQENIDTNAGLIDLMQYAPNLLELSAENITMFQVPGNFGGADYNASYWIPDMAALRLLVEEEFGYDASAATTNKPGTVENIATAKPANRTEKTAAPTREQEEVERTEAPEKTQKPTKAPADKTAKPEKTAKPVEKTEKPKETKKPVEETTKPEKTVKPVEETEEPKKTEGPSVPAETKAPVEKTATPTEAPVKTASPTRAPQKPTANPTTETVEE